MPCLILRIGFVGEVGYEIHCPAAHGEHLWDALMEAGEAHGLRPFGLEPQRILRLQKLHVLVGQDTDSESTPFGAAMPWIVKLDKEEDFIGSGRWSTRRASSPRPRSSASRWPTAHVPTEGAVVVRSGVRRRAGDVSSRCSPQLGTGHRPGVGAEGPRRRRRARSRSPTTARPTTPTVQTKPFYDPEGEVLRS